MRLFFLSVFGNIIFFFVSRAPQHSQQRRSPGFRAEFFFLGEEKKKTFSLAEIAYKKEAVRNEGESVKIVERERERERFNSQTVTMPF